MASIHSTIGGRGWAAGRRNAFTLFVCFTAVASLVLLVAPWMPRLYSVSAQLPIRIHPLDGAASLAQLPQAVVQEVDERAKSTQVRLTVEPSSDPQVVQLEASAPLRAMAIARLQAISDQLTVLIQHRGDEIISHYRDTLTQDADQLASQEEATTRLLDTFRTTHRDVLPEDPDGLPHHLEKLNEKLDDQQQRLLVVTAQIGRLEAYKKNGASTPPPTPLPALPVQNTDAPTVAAHPDTDPEVLALTAQLQLLNDQVDDQLNNKHRTEQHPYVVDLREQQTTIQKKLEAAKQRAATGQPPPSSSLVNRSALPANSSADASLAATQGVDFQLQALQAERDTLTSEIPALTMQRESLQKQMEGIFPIRQKYEQLTAQLASIQHDRRTLDTRMEQLHQPSKNEEAGGGGGAFVEVQPLAFASNSTWPSSPRLSLVCAGAILIAALLTAFLAQLLATLDRTLHSPEEASALLDIPIAGAIVELRTARQKRRMRLWRGVLQPALVMALAAMTVGSAVVCYRRFADPHVAQSAQEPVSNAMASYTPSAGRPRS